MLFAISLLLSIIIVFVLLVSFYGWIAATDDNVSFSEYVLTLVAYFRLVKHIKLYVLIGITLLTSVIYFGTRFVAEQLHAHDRHTAEISCKGKGVIRVFNKENLCVDRARYDAAIINLRNSVIK